jgi:hypothetical protein
MMSVPRYLSHISSSILSAPGSGSIPFSIAATAASAKVLAFCGERVGDSSTVQQRYFLDALFVKREGKMVVIDVMAKPHLRALPFGPPQVKEIVRRPFFAKVLDQSFVADPSGPPYTLQSEVDLTENWWARGGYNATGRNAIERQRASSS